MPGPDLRPDLVAFEDWMRSWGASDRTITDRMTMIRAGLRDWGGEPRTVTTETLACWLGRPGFAQWSKISYLYHVKSFFGWMVESGRSTSDPSAGLRVPRAPKDRPRPLSPGEVDTVLAASRGNVRTWLLLGLLAGLRAHEIAKIRGADVTEEEIFVLGKGRKQAMIPTHPMLWEVALTHPRGDWWFPSPRSATGYVTPESISTIVTRHFRKLGIEGSVHRTRHTYATQLLRSGANIRVVQELMRHDTLSTTAKYTQVAPQEMAAAIRGLDLGRAS